MKTLNAAICLFVCVVFAPRGRSDPASKVKDAVTGCAKEKWAGPANGFGCPLRKVHLRDRSTDAHVAADRNMSAMMGSVRNLRKQGFSMAELENETVIAEFRRLLPALPLCPRLTVTCNANDKFRSIDGTCNNLNNPSWGMAGAAERRLLKAAYDDGLNLPRSKGIGGNPLPFARKVSNAVHRGPQQLTDRKLTLQAFQFGQFLDHDIILTPLSTAVDDCCANNDDLDNCFNINFAEDDPFVPRFKAGYCMEVPRSAGILCKSAAGGILQRQQTNDLTSFVDASNVYGSSATRLALLREGTTAFMKVALGADGPRIPDGPDDTCRSDAANGLRCSIAGDVRVNEIPSLTSYHNLFVLEHNRLADKLKPYFSNDEEAFQQTRKLLIGIMQKIVYDEFLPAFLSPKAMAKHKLASSNKYTYDSNLDPTAANVFGIAFRMGHTWIPTFMSVFTKNFDPFRQTLTNLTFGDPNMTYIQSGSGVPSGMQGLAYALSALKTPKTDIIIEDVVRSFLFVNTQADTSFDLAALNTQRGRDHGLPSYNEFRKWCNLSEVTSWSIKVSDKGLVDHTLANMHLLKAAGYSSPQDIDIFPGAMSEKPVPGGSLGPTFECIIGDQFRRLKYGDRFFYQNENTGFNIAQQAAIKKYSLASLLCQNYKFKKIHFPNVFKQADQLKSCQIIADINMNPFCVAPGVAPPGVAPPGVAPPGVAPPGVAHPGVAPTGVAPQGFALTGVAPTGVAPTDVAATDVAPTDVAPTGVAPTGVAPTGVAPTGVAPTGIAPTGFAPTGVAPQGFALTGVAPSGVAPTDVAATDVAPADVAPSGVAPTGVAPTGIAPTGVAPTGVAPPGIAGDADVAEDGDFEGEAHLAVDDADDDNEYSDY